MNGVNFFLRTKVAEHSYHVGQPLECVIREVNLEARTVAVKFPTQGAPGNGLKDEPNRNATVPFISLTPGMRFEVIVDKKVNVSLSHTY